MPALRRLLISGIRNIESAEFALLPGFNLITGNNGSGKTSILEGIHFLSLGRSFRTHQHKPLIMDGASQALVYGETFDGVSIGVSRSARKGDAPLLKLNGSKVDTFASLTHELPLQLLNSDAFALIEGGPQTRRAFLDWGVFHVKHQFLHAWRMAKRALLNRNALLKRAAPADEIAPWSHELGVHAGAVASLRLEYLEELQQHFSSGLGAELEDRLGKPISIQYFRGWDESRELLDLLTDNLDKERRYGHTLYGPHRADLLLTIDGKPCAEVLSRGQLKLTISLLKIAQAQLLALATGRSSVFLVDDLPAELDQDNQNVICRHLASLQAQTFVTSIEATTERSLDRQGIPSRLFHVKHGKIQPVQDTTR
jgi:DNA replication and repair protein RecF